MRQVLGGILIGLVLVFGSSAEASELITTRITNNSVYDSHPDISGSNVVWTRSDQGGIDAYIPKSDWEI